LRVIFEPDEFSLIKQKPFRKIKFSKIYLDDKTIVCEIEGFKQYDFKLDFNDVVLGIISDIFAVT